MPSSTLLRPFPLLDVLLVEDSPGDVALTVEALREARVETKLHVVRNGEDALSFLSREGAYAEAPKPDLVLLDLNLPRKSGREVLAEMKADERLRRIPVVILSTSTNEDDISAAYDLAANCYVAKPVDLDEFVNVIRAIDDFWLSFVRLPAE